MLSAVQLCALAVVVFGTRLIYFDVMLYWDTTIIVTETYDKPRLHCY